MKTYGMFSETGNSAVAKIVECAETAGLSWFIVEKMLYALAETPPYSEATDTAVREAVWCELFGELE